MGPGVVEAIRRVGKELHRTGSTWADMADALAISNFCKKHSLDLEEVKDSLPAIVEKLNEHGLRLPDLPIDTEEKVKENADLVASAKTLKDEIKGLEENKANKLKDAGHTEESLARCREVSDFLAEHGLSPDAAEKLKNAISNAEASGFDGMAIANKVSTVESLEETRKALKTKFEEMEVEVEGLRIDHWKDKEAIDALKLLNEKGVKSSDILATKDLVEKEGTDLATIASKAARQGGLDKIIQESEKKVKDLETREMELAPTVEMLENRKEALEAVVNTYGETLKKTMQSMIDAANDAVTKIDEAGKQAADKIVAIGEKAVSVTMQFAKTRGVLMFEVLVRSANGEKVDRGQFRDAMVLALLILLGVLPPTCTYKYQVEALIKSLKEDSLLSFI